MRTISGLAMLGVLVAWIVVAVILVTTPLLAGAQSGAQRVAAARSGNPISHPQVAHSGRPAAPPHQVGVGHATASTNVRPTAANVYAATMSGQLAPSLARIPERVYVPNSGDGTVSVIDPKTFQVVDQFEVGQIPHHVTPSWDLTRLYVNNEGSSSLTVIDPASGKPIETIPVDYPYNLYFTPDGRKAIVVVERLSRLDFRDPHSWTLLGSVDVPWAGVDHMDFTADGRYALASAEWTGVVMKIDTVAMKIVGFVNVGGLPVDVRLAPDGKVFYVANQGRQGVSIIDPVAMKEIGFIPTGTGAHGLYVSRDTTSLYVSNRLDGTISVINFKSRRVTATWNVGGSPDMIQLSPDGRQLWVSGRYNNDVQVVDTRTGAVLHTIAVGFNPHGLSFFPNVGRFSLGHNGVYR
jgi:YVTN family beta-propeller protein